MDRSRAPGGARRQPRRRIAAAATVCVVAAALAGCSDDLIVDAADGAAVPAAGLPAAPAATATTATTGTAPPPTGPPTAPPTGTGEVTTVSGLSPAEVEALIADRPVEVRIPDALAPDEPAALLVVLHGYGGSSAAQEAYFAVDDEAAAHGTIVAHPDGTTDARGAQFWNATEACCNFFGSEVDDVEYLTAVVDHVRRLHPVDPARVFLAGHSNGGFMAYRLACERADVFAAVVALAGTMIDDLDACRPSEPVDVVHVHPTADEVIRYEGGEFLGGPYPSAAATVDRWAELNGCGDTLVAGAALDLDTGIDGDETAVARVQGCPAGGDVELWSMQGAGHLPALGPGFARAVFDFLADHPDE
jgi:polyhydroxybutyrate depolymerase